MELTRTTSEAIVMDAFREELEVETKDVETKAEIPDVSMFPLRIVLVLDASGSMLEISRQMREAVNSFIASQRNHPADGTTLSLIVFADEAKTRFANIPIGEVKDITEVEYECNGWTALYDAINLGIESHREEKNVVMVIVTDGMENKSNVRHETIAEKIEAKKAIGWKFQYLANNLDVSRAGCSIGLTPAGATVITTGSDNIAVGYENLAPTLARTVSEAIGVYRTSSEMPSLRGIERSTTLP